MVHRTHGRLSHQVQRICSLEQRGGALPFSHVLDREQIKRLIEELAGQGRQCTLNALTTFYAFLAQVLGDDQSCQQAMANLLAWFGPERNKKQLPSGDTGPYCKARQRLPQELPARAARQVGYNLHHSSRAKDSGQPRLLGGRPIKVADGSTISMPDTPQNQAAYPQARTQKPGVGFPIMRVVAILSLYCGALLELAHGPYRGKETGEPALLRTLLDTLEPDDVLLGDRYFCSYWMMAMLKARGVDGLFRMHQLRQVDFRKGRRLGRQDHVVSWERPQKKPQWMAQELYNAIPQELEVREVKTRIQVPGFRVKVLVLATTLLDAQLYPVVQLCQAFRARWQVELDLRSIKVAMKMDVLRCKSPAMVYKELWMHLLAYNLVRTVMAQAASKEGLEPRQVSFTAGMQLLRSFAPAMTLLPPSQAASMHQLLLSVLARQVVGDRPDRCEPRAIKRRPKSHKLLNQPRAKARQRLMAAA